MKEMFASYAQLREGCNTKEIIRELLQKGSEFIFLDAKGFPNFNRNLLSNIYSAPVFFMSHHDPDFFGLSNQAAQNISIFFPIPEKNLDGHTELDFFYVPSSPYTQRFVDMAAEVKRRLGDKVLFNPVIFTFLSKSEEFEKNNCVSKGEFCAYDPDNSGTLTGRMVIQEAIRQKCVFKTHQTHFLEYLQVYFQKCTSLMTQKCSFNIMSNLSIDSVAVQSCYNDSFAKVDTVIEDNHNSILEQDRKVRKSLGVTDFPNFYINDVKYEGSLDVYDLLMSICTTGSHETSVECRSIDSTGEVTESLTSIVIINLVIFVICLVFLVVFIRNKMKKKFKKEIKVAIDKYMTEYSAIRNDNSNLA